jgi:hypothetical protein
MEAIETPTLRWTSESLVRDTDQLVRDAYRMASRASAESPVIVSHSWLWRHDLVPMHLGRIVGRLADMVRRRPVMAPSIPPVPLNPDVKGLHEDLRAIGMDLRRAMRRYDARAKR